jgi:polyisoprenoid-binding protein YceI
MAIWNIDQAHTEIKFKAKHLVISSVTGQFNSFSGKIEAEKSDFTDAKISFEADVNSLTTKNEQRDGHLKSPDFFDAANFPKLTFVSKTITKKSDNDYLVVGDITIRGITKAITLNATFNGIVKGFGGVEVAGFELSGKLNRFDFGLHWNALTEAGGIAVGEEIKLDIPVELNKAA